MKIIVFGAAGTAGRRITIEARHRGHEVVPVVRDTARTATVAEVPTVAGDATVEESVAGLIATADAIVIAIGAAAGSTWVDAARAVTTALRALPAQERPFLLHMGGGATLTTPDGTPFLDLPDFPAEFLVPARGQAAALDLYRATDDLAWTYVSPPPVHFFVGERTGAYRTGFDQPVADAQGVSRLSYEDFAVAVVDELESPRFTGRRFTVGL